MAQKQSNTSTHNVYFIGGAPCSGKSTIVDLLAERYHLTAYHLDQHMYNSSITYDPDRQPVMLKWTTTPWENLWMQSPKVLFDEVVAAYEEQFHLAMVEISELSKKQPVIAEGNPFMPCLMEPLLGESRRAVWVVSTDTFLRTTYLNKRKDFIRYILRDCTQPEQAAMNWMDRDVAFARWVRLEAEKCNLPVIDVDGTRSIEENAEMIARALGFGI